MKADNFLPKESIVEPFLMTTKRTSDARAYTSTVHPFIRKPSLPPTLPPPPKGETILQRETTRENQCDSLALLRRGSCVFRV